MSTRPKFAIAVREVRLALLFSCSSRPVN